MKDSKKRILIVEDEPSLQKVLALKLSQAGFDTLTAEDGKKGLEMALKHIPDLILLDIKMPEMDGLTMLEKFREDDKSKDVPVIILTNYGGIERISNAVQLGTKGYLVKAEWDLDGIVKKVEDALGEKDEQNK